MPWQPSVRHHTARGSRRARTGRVVARPQGPRLRRPQIQGKPCVRCASRSGLYAPQSFTSLSTRALTIHALLTLADIDRSSKKSMGLVWPPFWVTAQRPRVHVRVAAISPSPLLSAQLTIDTLAQRVNSGVCVRRHRCWSSTALQRFNWHTARERSRCSAATL